MNRTATAAPAPTYMESVEQWPTRRTNMVTDGSLVYRVSRTGNGWMLSIRTTRQHRNIDRTVQRTGRLAPTAAPISKHRTRGEAIKAAIEFSATR